MSWKSSATQSAEKKKETRLNFEDHQQHTASNLRVLKVKFPGCVWGCAEILPPDLPENQDYASTAARIIDFITLQIHTF